MFARLREPETAPYDLVVFDEAHKLSAHREQDLRVRKTGRYRLAEAIARRRDRQRTVGAAVVGTSSTAAHRHAAYG